MHVSLFFTCAVCFNFFLKACGKMRAATGKAMLLVNKKFKQFKGLCDMNLVRYAFGSINRSKYVSISISAPCFQMPLE